MNNPSLLFLSGAIMAMTDEYYNRQKRSRHDKRYNELTERLRTAARKFVSLDDVLNEMMGQEVHRKMANTLYHSRYHSVPEGGTLRGYLEGPAGINYKFYMGPKSMRFKYNLTPLRFFRGVEVEQAYKSYVEMVNQALYETQKGLVTPEKKSAAKAYLIKKR